MTTSIWDALDAEGDYAPIFKFANPGDTITGRIVEKPKTIPLNAYGTREPKIGPDGKPVYQLLVVLATEHHADQDHDGRWRVYVDKPLMKKAVAGALREAQAADLTVGGTLTVTHTGMVDTRGGGTAKDFTATYNPPDPEHVGVGELGEYVEAAQWDEPVA